MSTEFTPLNPSNRPNPLTGEGVVGRYEQQGQRGQSGTHSDSNTPSNHTTESPNQPPPPDTRSLSGDTFWRNRRTTPLDNLFNESLPWETVPTPAAPPAPPPKTPSSPLPILRQGTSHLVGPGRDASSANRAVQKTWAAHQASIQNLKSTTKDDTAPLATLPTPPRSPFAGLPVFTQPEVPPTTPNNNNNGLPRSPQTTTTNNITREQNIPTNAPQTIPRATNHPTNTPQPLTGETSHPTAEPSPKAPPVAHTGDHNQPETRRKPTSSSHGDIAPPRLEASDQTQHQVPHEEPPNRIRSKKSLPLMEPKLNRAGVVCLVMDDRQQPVMGANLEWVPANDMLPVINAKTDSEGNYRAPDLNPGDYTLFTRAKGFIPQQQTVNLLANQANTVEVTIQKP
jgi:hypothetical protein